MESLELISAYSRAQAIADGELVDVTKTAKEAGFTVPVALTRRAFEELAEWTADDNRRQVYQDTDGRLWDVLWMGCLALRRVDGDRATYVIHSVPRDGRSRRAKVTHIKAVIGPGDTPDPVITIMLPGED